MCHINHREKIEFFFQNTLFGPASKRENST